MKTKLQPLSQLREENKKAYKRMKTFFLLDEYCRGGDLL